jgi:hypothetical protein
MYHDPSFSFACKPFVPRKPEGQNDKCGVDAVDDAWESPFEETVEIEDHGKDKEWRDKSLLASKSSGRGAMSIEVGIT